MAKILYAGSGYDTIQPIFEGFDTIPLSVPERPLSLEEASSIAAQVNVERVDLVFSDHITSIPVLLRLLDKGCKAPIIFVPHTNPYPIGDFLQVYTLLRRAEGRVKLVCGSEGSAKIYRELFGANPTVLPTYGVNQDMFPRQDMRASRERLGLDMDTWVLLYTGRLAPDKNIGAILAVNQALTSEHHNTTLLLTYNYILHWYIARLLEVWEPKNTRIMTLDKQSLKHAYGAADLFITCSTSHYETFGRSPLEANACGVPAVAPNWVGFNTNLERDGPNSSLARVDFYDEPLYHDKNYAMVDLEDITSKCMRKLDQRRRGQEAMLNPELNQTQAFKKYSQLIKTTLDTKQNPQDNTGEGLDHGLAEYFLSKLGARKPEDANSIPRSQLARFDHKEMFYKLFHDKANL